MYARRIAIFALWLAALAPPAVAVSASPAPGDIRIAFVPLDDRPATEKFPQEIAAICGVHLELPPQDLLGHFTRPGDADGVGRWLSGLDASGLTAVVVSTDMLAYGGLVASRTVRTPLGVAIYRLQPLERFHKVHPDVPIYAFGTVMRLAPTATAESEEYLEALAHYAQLAGVSDPTPEQSDALAISRSHIPDGVFWDYIGTRARDLAVDERLLVMANGGDFSALVLTQDDAGSDTGLQRADEAALHSLVGRLGLQSRVLLNPGADEMGSIVVVRAIEDAVHWSPTLDVVYPSAESSQESDPLEYTTIGQTVGNLAGFLRLNGDAEPDAQLDVLTPDALPVRQHFLQTTIAPQLAAGRPVAIADLSFLLKDPDDQRYAVTALLVSDAAAKPLAYASWNTTANTVGTALAETAATLIGRRLGTLDEAKAATFLFERYADDYGYRQLVRPDLQTQLESAGDDIDELGSHAEAAESLARAMLWPVAVALLDDNFEQAGWRADRLRIALPWQRTFEVEIDAALSRT